MALCRQAALDLEKAGRCSGKVDLHRWYQSWAGRDPAGHKTENMSAHGLLV